MCVGCKSYDGTRKFPVDFNVYGCAYIEDGKLCYRVSSNKEKMYKHVQRCVYEEIYPTMIRYLMHRSKILSDQYEEMLEETKYQLARQLQQRYQALFPVLQSLVQIALNNELLQQFLEVFNGNFDDGKFQILEGALKFALRAKILTKNGYRN